MPNNAQVEGAITSLVTGLGGAAGAFGYIEEVHVVALAGALATIGGVFWTIYTNRKDRLMAKVKS